ncbi:MAG: type II secretion system F family protein [Actinomycetales bacterium]
MSARLGDWLGSTFSMTGAILGCVFATGLLIVIARLPISRRPGLDARLGPYVRDAAPPSALLAGWAGAGAVGRLALMDVLAALLRPVTADAVRALDRMLGGSASVRRRLDQLGHASVEGFRAEQVVWGAAGLLAGVALALAVSVREGFAPVPMGAVIIACVSAGVLGRDQLLSHRVRAREQRILAEFPTVAELLALSVSAGEGAVAALDRVARSTDGELAVELRRTLADARAGATLVEALEKLAGRSSLPIVARFVDGVVVALDRGTPLADVLRAQAADVREAARRELMETGGKKEIAMMAPVVFLVLPVTVVFAIYPGAAVLSLQGP